MDVSILPIHPLQTPELVEYISPKLLGCPKNYAHLGSYK
jgi:hypothetical protein